MASKTNFTLAHDLNFHLSYVNVLSTLVIEYLDLRCEICNQIARSEYEVDNLEGTHLVCSECSHKWADDALLRLWGFNHEQLLHTYPKERRRQVDVIVARLALPWNPCPEYAHSRVGARPCCAVLVSLWNDYLPGWLKNIVKIDRYRIGTKIRHKLYYDKAQARSFGFPK